MLLEIEAVRLPLPEPAQASPRQPDQARLLPGKWVAQLDEDDDLEDDDLEDDDFDDDFDDEFDDDFDDDLDDDDDDFDDDDDDLEDI